MSSTTARRALPLFAAIALCAAPALADPAKVVFVAVDVGKVDAARAASVASAVKDVLQKALDDRLVVVAERPACAREPSCFKPLLEQHAADEVLWAGLEAAGGPGAPLSIAIETRDASGKVVARGKSRLPAAGLEAELAQLVYATVLPSRNVGVLVVDGRPAAGQVLVDDLPVLAKSAADRTHLSVGRHRVVFVGPGGEVVGTKEIDVPFGGRVVVAFPPPAPASSTPAEDADAADGVRPARARLPLWPAIVLGSAAGVALAVSGGYLAGEILFQKNAQDGREVLLEATRGGQLPTSHDPVGRQWRSYGPGDSADAEAARAAAAATGLVGYDTALVLSHSAIAGGLVVGLAGALGAGLLGVWSVVDADAEE